jgi:hypothetical protein
LQDMGIYWRDVHARREVRACRLGGFEVDGR